jgi:hypothetical protein
MSMRHRPLVSVAAHQAAVRKAAMRIHEDPDVNYAELVQRLAHTPRSRRWGWFVIRRYSDGHIDWAHGRVPFRWLARHEVRNAAIAFDEGFGDRLFQASDMTVPRWAANPPLVR